MDEPKEASTTVPASSTPGSVPTQAAALSQLEGNEDAIAQEHAQLPDLLEDRSFYGATVTQFLGAFNDNLFKQLILLLALAVTGRDRQAHAMFVFAASFLLCTGFAGYVSDRINKRRVIVFSKVGEIAVMAAGLIAFANGASFTWLMVILFFMGAQSAFFGPAKYGILPEMIRQRDLPRANGVFLMTTFLAIILGTWLAGTLIDKGKLAAEKKLAAAAKNDQAPPDRWEPMVKRLVPATCVCVAIAVIGTGSSLLIRRVPAGNPDLKLSRSAFTVPKEMRELITRDRAILLAVLVTSVFWMLGGIFQMAVNALGKKQLEVGDEKTSIMAAMVGVGIALGSVLGGLLSRGRIDSKVVRCGAAGIVICLFLLSLPGGPDRHLLGFYGSIPALIALGTFTGIFIVPIQVFLQSRPPAGEKGRMIAVMGQCNWLGILLGAGLYELLVRIQMATGLPECTTFAASALIFLPIALFYKPKTQQLGD